MTIKTIKQHKTIEPYIIVSHEIKGDTRYTGITFLKLKYAAEILLI